MQYRNGFGRINSVGSSGCSFVASGSSSLVRQINLGDLAPSQDASPCHRRSVIFDILSCLIESEHRTHVRIGYES